MDKEVYSIWLSLALGFGNPICPLLFSEFKTTEAIYENSDFTEFEFKSSKQRDALENKNLEKAFEVFSLCKSKNVGIIPYENEFYPKRLRIISSPPSALYYKGHLKQLNGECMIAVVGTRAMTEYGRESTYRFSYSFSKSGAVVVSGMADGVDAMAHRGAIDAEGYTVAVLGTSPDKVYPVVNTGIYNDLLKKGLIISEYYPSAPVNRFNFPMRNRIISGLSDAVLITEAGEHSGALITADLAVKQGKRVFALPGNVSHEGSLGTNELLKKGASMATDPANVLDEFELLYPDKIRIDRDSFKIKLKHTKAVHTESRTGIKYEMQNTVSLPDTLDKIEKSVYDIICKKQPVSVDEISAELNISAGEVMSAVSVLEIYMLIKAVPGGKYITV